MSHPGSSSKSSSAEKKRRSFKMRKTSDFTWPYHTVVDLGQNPKPKIAFLSGMEREYFPENPGHDRFAIAFSMSKKPTDTPQPNYTPMRFGLLSRPISKKGYGIGGLLGPRFAREYNEDVPGPGAYQPDITVIQQEMRRVHSSPSSEKLKTVSCPKSQKLYAFGSNLTVGRFGNEAWQPVGVGYYELRSAGITPKIPVNDGFRGGPAFIKPAPLTYCNYEKCDECFECGKELKTQDYYKSRGVVKIPQGALKKKKMDSFGIEDEEDEGERQKSIPRIISICRPCYCAAVKGKYKAWGWTHDRILWLFHKTRYCGYIHEHHQLPITLQKTSCKLVEKLNRKEAVMRKHYLDTCERSLKQKAKAKN